MRNPRFTRTRFLTLAAAPLILGACEDDPAAPHGSRPTPLQLNTFQAAAVVIGQTDKTSGTVNAGAPVGPAGLDGPFGPPVVSPSGLVYLPDEGNHRILVFDGVPTTDGATARFVMGQPDFTSNAPGTSASTFYVPAECAIAGGRLFVADLNNNRVLIWNSLPTSNVPADVVVGQEDFTTARAATSRSGLRGPIRVSVVGSRMFVLDFGNHRLLIWNAIPARNGAPADVVVGQPDFESSTPSLSPRTFWGARAMWTDGRRLVIGESVNRRVLIWNTIPNVNGEAADVAVGALDLSTSGIVGPGATSVGNPVGVASDGESLFVADVAFHRVLVFSPFPRSSGAAAKAVLGQSDFDHRAPNDSDQDGVTDTAPGAQTLNLPTGVSAVGNRLFVCDQSNHRVLVFTGR